MALCIVTCPRLLPIMHTRLPLAVTSFLASTIALLKKQMLSHGFKHRDKQEDGIYGYPDRKSNLSRFHGDADEKRISPTTLDTLNYNCTNRERYRHTESLPINGDDPHIEGYDGIKTEVHEGDGGQSKKRLFIFRSAKNCERASYLYPPLKKGGGHFRSETSPLLNRWLQYGAPAESSCVRIIPRPSAVFLQVLCPEKPVSTASAHGLRRPHAIVYRCSLLFNVSAR